jgi:hypothetical protein
MLARARELIFVVDYDLEDAVTFDLQVFFRIDVPSEMPGAEYWKRVPYLRAYAGSVAGRLSYEEGKNEHPDQAYNPGPAQAHQGGMSGQGPDTATRWVEPTKAAIMGSALGDSIEMD